MAYVFDFRAAQDFEKWFNKPYNRFSASLQNRLMLDLLQPKKNETVLFIGCGTGASIKTLLDLGLQTTSIDPSPYLIDIAHKNLGGRVELHRGFAEDLPFDDNSFNYTCLVTSLEFTENPKKAIEEAGRTAKDKMYLCVFNKYSLNNVLKRIQGIFFSSFFNRAQFFTVWELKQILRELLGDVPVSWRTVCQFPFSAGTSLQRLEQSALLQRLPFGEYTGVVVTLTPRFRTTPLPLTYRTKQTREILTG